MDGRYKTQVTGYRAPVTGYRAQVTDYRSQVAEKASHDCIHLFHFWLRQNQAYVSHRPCSLVLY